MTFTSVCGTLGKRFISLSAALNIMSVADFCAERKPKRLMIVSGRFFDVERQVEAELCPKIMLH